MTRFLLTFLALITIAVTAHAQLGGTDTKPGDACTAAEEGYVRRNASADRDINEITLICDGSQWQSAAGGGLAALQGQDDTGPCTEEKDGLIRYRTSGNPKWEYCDGGTTSWLPFRLPQCQNDDAGVCTLAALRSSNDPQFKASSIRCGDKVLGVTGTYGNGSSSAFTFTDVTNASLSTLTTASAVTISGIPAGCPGVVEVSGQGGPQISINGGTWSTSSTISNGQTLAVRLTSSGSFSTAHTATIAIGATEDTWTVTTLAADTTPNAFTFTEVTGANPSTLTTATSITISGVNTSTPVSVTGTGATISINGGSWVTSGTITNGQTLAVRLTSSGSFSTAMSATINVGGVTDSWSVTTRAANNCTAASRTWLTNCTATVSAAAHGANGTGTITNPGGCGTTYYGSGTFACSDGTFTYSTGTCTQQTACDTAPNAFSFTPNLTDQALNTLVYSNTVTISGFNTSTSVSVSGTGSPQISINGGGWVTSGSITNGQTLRVRLTTANANATARTAAVNVGGVTDAWSATTEAGCGGVMVGGYCWYMGAANASCTSTCAAHGGSDDSGTINYAGSGGSNAGCSAVAVAILGESGVTQVTTGTWHHGCVAYKMGASWWIMRYTSGTTTAAASSSSEQRFCSCNN